MLLASQFLLNKLGVYIEYQGCRAGSRSGQIRFFFADLGGFDLDPDPHLFADPDPGMVLKNGLFSELRTWIRIRICIYVWIQMGIRIFFTPDPHLKNKILSF